MLLVALVASATVLLAGTMPSDATVTGSRSGSPSAAGDVLTTAFEEKARDGRLRFPKTTPKIGTVRTWPAFDFARSSSYPKDFTLRHVGEHVELWVASPSDGVSAGLDFPAGDCRNGSATQVTDAQLRYLGDEFDRTILPVESAVFSIAPERDGKDATLPELVPSVPSSAFKGEGDNVVVLVDQIRGPSFYDRNNANFLGQPWGFVSGSFGGLTDRNVVTISGFAWLHRLGPAPVHSPAVGDPCRDHPAFTNAMEAVLAHEYQHLLERYEDPDEETWVDEGLSTWVEARTGYVDPRQDLGQPRHSPHVQCFLGHAQALAVTAEFSCRSGPENSLTRWGDQGSFADGGIWADYGATGTFMTYLSGRYGDQVISALHRHDANGLDSLRLVLAELDPDATVEDVLADWAAAIALDGVLDDGAALVGGDPSRFSAPTLRSLVNWDVPEAYAGPGAPPNGSDYVRLRDPAGAYLAAGDIESISFQGSPGVSKPVEWTVDAHGHGAEDPALSSGSGFNLDRSIVRAVTVPVSDPVLTFDTRYQTEAGWDFGFVQVSTDGGATYRSLPATTTTSSADPRGLPSVLASLPGFTGDSTGWVGQEVDLAAYAGQDVLLSFRFVTDGSVDRPGWWIDNVAVGGATVTDGATLDGWQTATQVRPLPVGGWSVRLVAYTDDHQAAWSARLTLDGSFRGSLAGAELEATIGSSAQTVAAIVTADDPAEALDAQPRYELRVNGAPQPGG